MYDHIQTTCFLSFTNFGTERTGVLLFKVTTNPTMYKPIWQVRLNSVICVSQHMLTREAVDPTPLPSIRGIYSYIMYVLSDSSDRV